MWKDGSVSVATAAEHLGVPCSAVWHQILEGRLRAYAEPHGSRVYTRVLLTADDDAGAPLAADGTPLTAQVARLTTTIERLTAMVQSARCDGERAPGSAGNGRHRSTQRRPAVARLPDHTDGTATEIACGADGAGIPPLEAFLRAGGGPPQALRPNPMTHPVEELALSRPDSRDDLLEPVRQLFEQHQRQWWQRLPLVSRG